MKIAVLLSGRIVTSDVDFTVRNIKTTFGKIPLTFFVSINESAHDQSFTERFVNELGIESDCINVEPTRVPDEIRSLLKKPEVNFDRAYSMFFHNKRAFEMMAEYSKRNRVQFDVVVKYRSDIASTSRLPLEMNAGYEKNTIYIPRDYDFGGINDQIAYGSPEAMRKYCACVDNIVTICSRGVIFHPETLLANHLKTNFAVIQRFNFDYKLKK